jgi:DNA polymerase I
VRSVIADLKHRKVPLHDLIIWKTLTKTLDDYAIKAPHVQATNMIKEKGRRLTRGDKVGYVILEGKERYIVE